MKRKLIYVSERGNKMHLRVDRKYFHRVKTNIICHLIIVALISGLFAFSVQNNAYGYTDKTGVVVDVVTTLNVRSDAGTGYSIVGSLTNGYVVTIKGEKYASNGALWYNVTYVDTSGKTVTGYVSGTYIKILDDIQYEPDADFEQYMTSQGFPESYKNGLRLLHAKYPNWVFLADNIDLDFNTVVDNEYKINPGSENYAMGRSLISVNSISSWKSTDTKAYDWSTGKWYGFDGNSWVAASRELVAYALDPRNFLDETYIFQFESLSYEPSYQTAEGLSALTAGKFLSTGKISDDNGGEMTYIDAIMSAANISGASPFYLAASIVQEIGSNGNSGSISGTEAGYEGYYNYYNIGAYTGGGRTAIQNGLLYAMGTDAATYRPWNTRYKAIVGGAVWTAKNYISRGQDTLYYKKFDFVDTPYTHQYMTHIIGARQEAVTSSKGYTEDMKKTLKLVFKIPVFKNMPETVCAIPTKDGSPNNVLSGLSVDGISITPSFNMFTSKYDAIVENSVKQINISAKAVDGKAVVSGAGKHTLKEGNNDITIAVKAENGDIRNYVISVVRKSSSGGNNNTDDSTTDNTTDNTTENNVNTGGESDTTQDLKPKVTIKGAALNETEKIITGISVSTTTEQLKSCISVENGTVKITDKNGTEKQGVAGTGDKVRIYSSDGNLYSEYNVIIYGDINGDGEITVKDALMVRKHILGMESLSGSAAQAANVNRQNDGITVKDALLIRKHVLGMDKIVQ